MDFPANERPRRSISKNNENIVSGVQFSAIFKERKIKLSPQHFIDKVPICCAGCQGTEADPMSLIKMF